jgi:hypothetical protein
VESIVTLDQYRTYLELFNARDYEGILSYFDEGAEIAFAGLALRGHRAVREFYRFFHAHVDETISLSRFLSDNDTVVVEAVVRLKARRDLTAEMLAAKGLDRLVALRSGETVEMRQFIHYHIANGRFSHAECAVVAPVEKVITDLSA